jgi:glutamyl-tRNA reductase
VELVVVGLNHRTASVEVRERIALDPDQVREALRVAKGEKILGEALILSTCNRTEVYSLAPDAEKAEAYVRDLISRFKGSELLGPDTFGYIYRDRETVRHLFKVASGLDSMMLGEMQILGQVKDAYAMASEGASAGVFMNRLLSTALRVGKRARAETEIGAGAVSIASAAVTLTTKIFSDLSSKHVLLVGAGDTGRLAAKHFAEERPAGMMIANRTIERAQAVAQEMGGEALSIEALGEALRWADVVVCATRAPGVMIDAAMVRRAMHNRGERSLVLVDIAVPRDVDPACAHLDNVFVYSIDALKTIVDQNLSRRRREVPKVEAIVEEEIEGFFEWVRSLEVAPIVRGLTQHFEAIRAEEVRRQIHRLPGADRNQIEALTKAIINKILHNPITRIKAFDRESEDGLIRLDTVRELFGLEPENEAGGVRRTDGDGEDQ